MLENRGKEYATPNRGSMPDKAKHMKIKAECIEFLRRVGAPKEVAMRVSTLPDGRRLMRTVNPDGTEWRAGEALPGARATAGATPRAAAPSASPLSLQLKRACDPRTRHIAAAVKAEAAGFPRLAEARRRLAESARTLAEIEESRDAIIAGLREKISRKEDERRTAEERGDDWRYCQLTREIESLQARIHGIETSKPVA